jgi:hypothetical protein
MLQPMLDGMLQGVPESKRDETVRQHHPAPDPSQEAYSMQQATCAHSGADTGTSPEKITNVSPSRRALLGFAGVGAIALAAPLAARIPVTSRWNILQKQWNDAAEAADQYWQHVYQPARKRIEAFTGATPDLYFLDDSNGGGIRWKVHPRRRSPFGDPVLDKRHDDMADRWNEWMARSAEAERQPDWQNVSEHMDRLWDSEHLARNALVNEPAPDGAAFALKVQIAMGNDHVWDGDREALIADAARLLSNG